MLLYQILHNHFNAVLLEEFVTSKLVSDALDDLLIFLLAVVDWINQEHLLLIINHVCLINWFAQSECGGDRYARWLMAVLDEVGVNPSFKLILLFLDVLIVGDHVCLVRVDGLWVFESEVVPWLSEADAVVKIVLN